MFSRGHTRCHTAALLAFFLSRASLAAVDAPACDARGLTPMTVPCEIRTASEPTHSPLVTGGLVALGVPLATIAILPLHVPIELDLNGPVVGQPAPGLGPEAPNRIEPRE